MSYQSVSVVDLLAGLNAKNATTFTLNDVEFSNPVPVSGTWKDQTTLRNTGIVVGAKAGGQFKGRKSIVYDRLKLNDLNGTNLKGFTLTGYGVTSAHGLIPWLSYWNGLHFTTDDIEDTAIVDAGDGTRSVVLTAKTNSIGWIGSVTLNITAGGASLNSVVTDTTLEGLNYPTANDTDTYAQLYMYGYDFTSYFNTLATLNAGALPAATVTALVAAFKALDIGSGKTLWNESSSTATWSLSGATVVSNGLNSAALPTNPNYKYALALKLRDAVTTPSGIMYLHYNDPYDLNA